MRYWNKLFLREFDDSELRCNYAVKRRTLMALICLGALRLAHASQAFELTVLSSRPDTVSGGDALLGLRQTDSSSSTWIAQLNGRDVTQSFHPTSTGSWLARVPGLQIGNNVLLVRVNGVVRSELTLVNHPLAGPIFSGSHQEPFICQTTENGLGIAKDKDCSAKTIVQYYYKAAHPNKSNDTDVFKEIVDLRPGRLSSGFKVYDTHSPVPADVARITTSDGREVNYIVRREIGTINRAVYDIQFLHQPGQPLPNPWNSSIPGWNGRLLYVFGEGCAAGYHQGLLGQVGGNQEPFLLQGYAVATSTLNMFSNNCNDRLSAETLSMVKEHFIKEFGQPVHTIGWGSSGGAIQQLLIAQNYPGLLDGLIVNNSFPDITSHFQSGTDCGLLDHAFHASAQHWTEPQKTAVSGFATWRACTSLTHHIDPLNCDSSLPKKLIYDKTTNPTGVRCDIYDNEINAFTRDPQTKVARRPLDNVGVQYGWRAFNDHKIDVEQFVELNELMGGFDADGNIIAARTEADAESIQAAFSQGLVLTGGGLDEVPIIDWHWYSDDLADEHTILGSFATRARLIAANGNADNQVVLVGPRIDFLRMIIEQTPSSSLVPRPEHDFLRQMNRWLDQIKADTTDAAPSVKVLRNRPGDLTDGCWNINGEQIRERADYASRTKCNQLYPSYGDPRIAAGGPSTDDVLKCTLKAIAPTDYSSPFTADQLDRLRKVFPNGVCDYQRPGIGRGIIKSQWPQLAAQPR
jgi:hypothetical protein